MAYGAHMYLYAYGRRTNSAMRFRVQKLVDSFREATGLHSNMKCIFAHARKGDRVFNSSETFIRECKNTSSYSVYDKLKGADVPIKGLEKMFATCHGQNLPFSVASLSHYLNASFVLSPDIKHIFLATDDFNWLDTSIDEYQTFPLSQNLLKQHHATLYTIHSTASHKYAETSLDTAVEFLATIEIGQQCEGFVGFHDHSAATKTLYFAMCYYSNGQFFNCPKEFQFN